MSTRESSDGFILVAVLWILGAIATLAAVYALYAKASIGSFVNHDDRLQAQGLELAGIELAVFKLTEKPDLRPSQGKFRFRLAHANIAVDFCAETSRIDLNLAPKPLLAGLFVALGADGADADGFANRIVARRTPPNQPASRGATPSFPATVDDTASHHGPFQSIDALALVDGLPADVIERARPYLTVYSGDRRVNALSASIDVLSAVPGLTPERLQWLLAQREASLSPPQGTVQTQLGPAAPFVTLQGGKTNRIAVDVQFDDHRRFRSETVVILFNDDPEPYHVLSWHDRTDDMRDDHEPCPSAP